MFVITIASIYLAEKILFISFIAQQVARRMLIVKRMSWEHEKNGKAQKVLFCFKLPQKIRPDSLDPHPQTSIVRFSWQLVYGCGPLFVYLHGFCMVHTIFRHFFLATHLYSDISLFRQTDIITVDLEF